jgi:hypothetical protein
MIDLRTEVPFPPGKEILPCTPEFKSLLAPTQPLILCVTRDLGRDKAAGGAELCFYTSEVFPRRNAARMVLHTYFLLPSSINFLDLPEKN